MNEQNLGNIGGESVGIVNLISTALKTMLEDINKNGLKGIKPGELLKLIELHRELGTEKTKDVTARWVETWEAETSNEQ